ncbi:hypothetical protein D1BOALGB6SA_2880 [Olavius sp. associated proteobacterium Delta 1]|nr:hypothetical protein D1BOALGB6SA_2880 [Olavius sp. associated proteobacterium Delta 1]
MELTEDLFDEFLHGQGIGDGEAVRLLHLGEKLPPDSARPMIPTRIFYIFFLIHV